MAKVQEVLLSLIKATVSGAHIETLKADICWEKLPDKEFKDFVLMPLGYCLLSNNLTR